MLPGALVRTLPFLAIALEASPAAAQQPTFDVQEVIGRPHLTATNDGAEGGAGGYGIRFDRSGWSFGTSGAARDATPCTLRYELEALGRRTAGGVFDGARVADAAPQVEGSTVRFARPTFVERYELRRDGVEQSFVFDALPEGDGDLVVRGRLQTDLPASASEADVSELRFTRADEAGISIGRVTGIDARGVKAEGTMRYADGRLDLVLPASFVRNAALPLVVDPLVGPTTSAGPPFFVQTYGVDVGYDASTDLFLVAWSYLEIVFADGGVFARVSARRVAPDGTHVGSIIHIDQGNPLASSGGPVRVTPAGKGPGFVVAYELHDVPPYGGLYGRYVNTVTGRVTARVQLVSELFFPQFRLHDVGTSGPGDAAIVVYDLPSGLVAARLALGASGLLTLGGQRTLAPVPPGAASISTNAGPADRQLVVWDEQRATEQNLFCAFLDSELNLLDGGAIGLSSTNKRAAAVDGDGTKWCVAYETLSATPSVGCFGVYWDPNSDRAYVTSDVEVAASGSSPAVAWTGESYLVAYIGGAKSIDPFSCLPCEDDLALPQPTFSHRLASQKSSSPTADDLAMIFSGNSIVTFFRSDDGLLTDLGGGCERGGRAAATCARAGNTDFTLRVRGALPFAPAALILSGVSAGLSCGPCTLVPDPSSGLALSAGSTDRFGDAAVPVPLPDLPSLIGAAFLEQWLVVGGGSCLGSLDLSNALRVEIQ